MFQRVVFHRIVTILLLGCMFAGGFDVASASSDTKSRLTTTTLAPPLSVEQYCAAPKWEFIRNGVTNHEDSAPSELPPSWFPAKTPNPANRSIPSEQARLRPSGLILLCERAVQKRSGVLKS